MKVYAQLLCLSLGGSGDVQFLISHLCYLPHQALHLLGCFSCALLRLPKGFSRGTPSSLCGLPRSLLNLLSCLSCDLLSLLGGSPRGYLGLLHRLAYRFFHSLLSGGLL